MQPSVEQLLKVQKVDSEMNYLRRAMHLRPQELQDDEKKVTGSRAALRSVETQLKQLRMDADGGELKIKSCDAEIEKLNVNLNSAKTNQEYAVLREQIQRKEEERGKVEEEVLERLGEIDQLDQRRGQLKRESEEHEKIYARRKNEVAEIVQGLQAQIDRLSGEREQLVVDVDPQHLSLYERVLARHGDFAIGSVRDSICQGCFMTVTAQEVNLLMLGKELIQCKSCSRLLYLED